MLDSKFFITLVGLIVAVFAICNTNMSPAVNEGYWGTGNFTHKVHREVQTKGGCGSHSLQNNYQAMLGNDKFVQYPKFQGLLSPRFSNVAYGANIKYNTPSYGNLASPSDPLALGDMATKNYQNTQEIYGCSKGRCGGDGCGVATCGKGGVSLGRASQSPNISEDSNYFNAMNKIYESDDYTKHTVSNGVLAVGDMTTVNAVGNVEQPIVYDRYIYANQKSKLRQHGDMIRGDLAIVPDGGNWFSVHPHPNIDLHEGAMNVMGGVCNGTAQDLANLNYATSGSTKTISGGLDITNQFTTTMGAAGGDIKISSFA